MVRALSTRRMGEPVSEANPIPGRARASAWGQLGEWLVWCELVASSDGDLHVFLPLRDEGIDGIIHRISTDQYAPVQVKSALRNHGGINVRVPEQEVQDDRAFLVAVERALGNTGLGPDGFVVPMDEFRRLAGRFRLGNVWVYDAHLSLAPRFESPWSRWCIHVEAMADRLLPASERQGAPTVEALPADWEAAGHLGFRGEMELLRRAADCDRLNVFKAFPDLEPNEYVMYDLVSRGILGIQVKAIAFAATGSPATLNVYRPALRPSPRTWFVLFASSEGASSFMDQCLVMPSTFVALHLSGDERHGVLDVPQGFRGRLAQWRVPTADLGVRLAEVAAALP